MAEERRIVTVLFADVAGSTAMGEELDPEIVRSLLGCYYVIAKEVVDSFGGTLEKFIGDAVMAVFGLPMAHGDDAERAVAAALVIREKVAADSRIADLELRFGLATGEVVATRDTSGGDFLITGDAVNTAARLQQAAESSEILATVRTERACMGAFDFGAVREIVAKGKSAPVSACPVLARRSRRRTPARLPLFGRDGDLEQLQLVARRAFRERRPSLVSMVAPAGTGKTRLLEEFLDWLPEIATATVATAQCLPYGQSLTYWPMRQVLFSLVGIGEESAPAEVRAAIGGWLEGLGVDVAQGDLLAATIGLGESEAVDRALLFAAWREAVEACSRKAPLVMIFEDLHWSSDSLLDLVEFLMQPRGEAPLMMIALTRPELLDRRPNWGGGRRNHLSLSLEPLADAAVGELVQHLLEGDSPDLVGLVVERSEGNPFYAGELVRSAIELGSIDQLPDTVQATVLARIDLLPAAERRLLQVGAVFGRAFRPADVAAIEPLLAKVVEQVSEELSARDLVRPGDGGRYAFRHILIREVAYQTLPRTERARLHAAAARWLEASAGSHEVAVAEIVALHYREAARLAVAIDPESEATRELASAAATWLGRAADVAVAAAAAGEAARHLRAALELTPAEGRARILERLGDVLAGDAGVDSYQQAITLYEVQGASVEDRLRAQSKLIQVITRFQGSMAIRISIGAMNEMRERARQLAEICPDELVVARFLVADAFYPFWVQAHVIPTPQELGDAERNGSRALEIATRNDLPDLVSSALDALSGLAIARSDWALTRDLARRRLTFESRINMDERFDAHAMVCWMSIWLGDVQVAERDSAPPVARLQPGQATNPAVHLVAQRSYALTLLGRWKDAVTTGHRLYQMWVELGRPSAGYALRGFVAAYDAARGLADQASEDRFRAVLETILSTFPPEHVHRHMIDYLAGDGRIAPDEMRAVVSILPDHVERRLSLACDRRSAIDPEALEMLLKQGLERNQPLLEAQVRRARGLARYDPGELAQALAIFDRAGMAPYAARARIERAALTGDAAELAAGIHTLEMVGDVEHLGRLKAT